MDDTTYLKLGTLTYRLIQEHFDINDKLQLDDMFTTICYHKIKIDKYYTWDRKRTMVLNTLDKNNEYLKVPTDDYNYLNTYDIYKFDYYMTAIDNGTKLNDAFFLIKYIKGWC